MRKGYVCTRLLIVAVVLLVSLTFCSCGIFTAAGNMARHVLAGNRAETAAPTAPNEGHATAGPEAGPILDRDFDQVPFSLINDRLFIQMPVGAQDIARQQDMMSAERSQEAETRLVLEENGQQLIVFARETFYCSDNLDTDLDRLLIINHEKSFSYQSECIRKDNGGFTVFHVTPDQPETGKTTVLIREAVIRNTDGTVITVGVHVTPAMAVDMELCRKQADRILQTIKPGTRKWLTKAHDGTIAEELNIRLEKDYVLFSETGADFLVYYIQKITKVDEPAPFIGIYIGQHPTLMYPQRGAAKDQLIKIQDNVLKTKVEWWAYKPNPNKDSYSAETVFDLPRSEMLMHIFIDAADEAEFLKIKEMIKTMRFK